MNVKCSCHAGSVCKDMHTFLSCSLHVHLLSTMLEDHVLASFNHTMSVLSQLFNFDLNSYLCCIDNVHGI